MIPFRDGTLAPGASTPSRICARRSARTFRYTASVTAPMSPPASCGPAGTGGGSLPSRSGARLVVRARLLLPGERQAVTHREHDHVHPVVGESVIVEVPDRLRVLIRLWFEDRPVEERVVHQDDTAAPEPRHDLFPVADVAGLVRVDESEVERGRRRETAQRVQARAQPELDAVGQAGFLPVRACQRRPFLAYVAADELPPVGQAAGQAEG